MEAERSSVVYKIILAYSPTPHSLVSEVEQNLCN